MWDAKTLKTLKTIEVQGGPDAILFDPFNERVYIFSHTAPHATAINAADGSVAGTLDLGGMPEQAVTDGKGHVYVDIRDRDNVAVIDARTLTVSAHYGLEGKGGRSSGLAIDVKNEILFAACREPQRMVMLSAVDGKILDSLPTDRRGLRAAACASLSGRTRRPRTDGAGFVFHPRRYEIDQGCDCRNAPRSSRLAGSRVLSSILMSGLGCLFIGARGRQDAAHSLVPFVAGILE
jgi:hypothetical protein